MTPDPRPRPTLPTPTVLPVRLLLAGLLLAALPTPGAAQDSPPAGTEAAEAAFLFAYRARPGMRDAFDEGYRRHLEWHAEHDDPFVWYGWDVASGDDLGIFVDGTFGPTPADFDRRVAPGEDAADFAATVAPFAEPLWRRVYRVRSDLGTTRFLEDREPTRFTRALRYDLRPGSAPAFEALLGRLAERAGRGSARRGPAARAAGARWAAYQLLDGGAGPAFLLLVPADGVASVAAGGPVGWLEARAGGDATRVREVVEQTVVAASSALWVLRPDLTLIPGAGGDATGAGR